MRWLPMVFLVLLTLSLPPPLDATHQPLPTEDTKTRVDDEKVLHYIESNLMTLFGFTKRPRPSRDELVIPPAMVQLYKRQTGMDLDTTNLALPGKHTVSANTVRSFHHIESDVDQQFVHNHRFRLSFPVDSIPNTEKLHAAELELSRVPMTGHDRPLTAQQILVYDIVLPGVRGLRQPVLRVVDSKRVWLHQDEAVKLDVTPAVRRWLQDARGNHGLLVKVLPLNANLSVVSRPSHVDRHVRLKREVGEERGEWKKVEPVLFTYTDDGKYKRRASGSSVSRLRRGVKKSKMNTCRRHELYVDFMDVGWNDWIVAPPGYDAYYCSGDCPFPLSDHFNSTNHAIVQTLVNSVSPNAAPKACCVPTTLAPVSMLYVDEENKVVLKNYQDMSIVGCGCR